MDPVFHFVEYLRRTVPGIKLVEKKKSRLMKFLGFLCFFNEDFMTKTTTAVGKTIYLPTHVPHDLGLMQVIAHEYVHLVDMQREGTFRFLFRYLSPQTFALFSFFALLAPLEPNLAFFLLSLGMLAPIASPWRLRYEERAYGMSLLFDLWVRGYVNPAIIDKVVDTIHGPSYYWVGGSKKHTRFYFEITLEDAKRDILPVGDEYREVWSYLSQEKYSVKPSQT